MSNRARTGARPRRLSTLRKHSHVSVDRDIVAKLLSFTQLCLKCVLSYLVSLTIPLPWVTSGPSIPKLMWVCPILGIWVSIPLLNIDRVLMTGSFPVSCCFYHHAFCCLFTGLWRGKASWLLVLCVYAHFFSWIAVYAATPPHLLFPTAVTVGFQSLHIMYM